MTGIDPITGEKVNKIEATASLGLDFLPVVGKAGKALDILGDTAKLTKAIDVTADASRVASTVNRTTSTIKASKLAVNTAKVTKGAQAGTWLAKGEDIAFDANRTIRPAEKFVKQAADGGWKAVNKVDKALVLPQYSAKGGGGAITVAKGIGNPVPIVGKGNTGRTIANNLGEQFAMQEVMSNPLKGAEELTRITLKDTRWPATEGWVKMRKVITLSDGNKVDVHYVYNKITDQFDDFQFKDN